MGKLIKADFVRMIKDKWFLAGCILAVAITALFTANGSAISVFRMENKEEFMIFISAGTMAFASLFTVTFLNTEYADGVIRNKIIAGHKQFEIYGAHLIGQILANMIMVACWFVGGMLGGARFNERVIIYTVIMIFYNCSAVSILTVLGMRIRKKTVSPFMGVLVLYILFNCCMVGNALISLSKGLQYEFFRLLYHFSPVGQWLANSHYAPCAEYHFSVELVISLFVCAVAFFIGTYRINERELQ